MEAAIKGQYVGSFTKQFKGKDGKDISYYKVVLFNPDFFKESDRYINIPITQEVYKMLNLGSPEVQDKMMGKTYSFEGSATPAEKGLLKFRITSLVELKAKKGLTPEI